MSKYNWYYEDHKLRNHKKKKRKGCKTSEGWKEEHQFSPTTDPNKFVCKACGLTIRANQ